MFQAKVALIRYILRDHFGEIVENVGSVLATKGPLPLVTIVQASSPPLNVRAVKEALLVLIHHNLVQYRPAVAMGDSITQPVIYRLSRDRALLRLALPLLIRSVYIKGGGKEEEQKVRAMVDLLKEVIKQGRLQLTEAHDETAISGLFNAGFIELVTPADSIYGEVIEGSGGEGSTPSVESSSPARKRSRNVTIPTTTSVPGSPSRKRARKGFVSNSNSPRTTDYVRWSLACLAHIWEEYLIEYARITINSAAGTVMQAILQVIGSYGDGGSKEDTFGTFQVTTRLSPLASLPVEGEEKAGGGRKSAVAEYLECMAQDIPFITKEDTRNDGLYRMSARVALQTLRLRCIESFIRARLGQPSARIWRILMDKQFLEEKTISKIAMITPKEARERLYGLLRMGLLALQEVPKTLDHAPSRTFYLWHIREDAACAAMAGLLERTLNNVLVRMRWEREQHRTIIAKSERSDVAANPALLAPGEQQQLRILRSTLDRLLLQQTRLTRELLLFDQFLVE